MAYINILFGFALFFKHYLIVNKKYMINLCYRLTPNGVHVHIYGTCGYVPLYDKRDFADMINLRIFKWEDFPGF